MTNNTHSSLSSGAQRFSLFRYSARLLTLLLLLVAATTQAKADDFYTYTYDGQYNLYKVALTDGFKAELNKASGGEFTGKTAAGSTVTWKTGDALPAFDGNYNGGTDTSFPLSLNSLFGNCSNVTSLDLSNYNTANVTNMSYLFYNCGNLKSVNLSNLNTEKVTTMESMFEECSSLQSVDLSKFNTAQVTAMSTMFANCKALTALDLSSFSLKDGVTLTNMFSGTCEDTQTLIFGLVATDAIATALNNSTTGINTAKLKFTANTSASFKDDFYTYTYDSSTQVYKVTLTDAFKTELNKTSGRTFTGTTAEGKEVTWKTGDPLPAFDSNYDDGTNGTHSLSLEGLFSGCSAMTSLDLSNYNTTNVTSMLSMFYNCTSLESLDLSNFNTANVTSMQMMFYGCSALTSLKLSSNFNTANVWIMESMFNGCSNLSSLDVSNFNTENVYNMGSMFKGCSSLSSLDVSNFNTAIVTNMSSMFKGCSRLSSLDVSKLNTEKVRDMASMFEGCSSLSSLNLSSFNTASMTNMKFMFSGCTALSTLDLSKFNTASVTNMTSMFADCKALTALDLSSFSLKDGVTLTSMFSGTCDNTQSLVYGLVATDAIATALNNSSTTGIDTNKLKFRVLKDEFYTYTYDSTAKVYKVALSDAFKAELNKANDGSFTGFTAALTSLTWKTGDPLPAFNSNYDDGTNGTHPLSLKGFFSGCSAITSLDLSNYNTANVTDMSFMFWGCKSLQSVNLTSFNTEKVTTMPNMFYGCSSLKALDLSNFDTGKVTDMSFMFNGCSSLSSLDLSKLNTTNVTSMGSLFMGCSSLQSVNLSSFNTVNVINMASMFNGCSSLKALDLSNFDTGKVTDMSAMFMGCSSLSSLDLSKLNTTNVKYMSYMFRNCSSLSSINLTGSFHTSNARDMRSMFEGCTALTSLDLTNFTVDSYYNLTSMFTNTCNNSQTVVYGLAATDAIATLLNNSSRTGINTDKLKFRVLKDEFYTYTYDSNAQVYKVALSNAFKAELNKTNDGSFTGLTAALTSLTWKTGDPLPAFNSNYNDGTNGTHPLSLEGLFNGCSFIASLDLSNYNTANVTDMSSMFYQCLNLSSLNLSKFNTEKVTTMENMFNGCQTLSSIVLTNFNTANLINMRSMFDKCSNLTSLNLSNFNTANVTSMYGMFRYCGALSSINLNGFSTAKVTDMQNMFDGCNVLTSLDLTSFTLNGSVNLKNMFRNTCSNNQALVYGLAATEDIANTLNNSGTTTINTDKLMFVVTLLAIDEANFPDAVFRKFVSDNYDTNGDGYLAGKELSVTTMDVSGKGIGSMKGVEHFTSLTSLNCSNNALTTVDLSRNTSLTTFNGAGQIVAATLSYDENSKKVYFDITGAEAAKLSVTGFTLTGNGTLRATSNDALTERKMFDQADYTSDTGLGSNKLSGQFSLRTYALLFDTQYATLCLPWNATVPVSLKAYTVTLSGNSALLLAYEGTVLPKETAFVVEGTGTLLLRHTDSQATAATDNDLKGTTSGKTVTANSVMTFGHSNTTGILGFYTYTGTTIDAYKGYLNKVSGAKSYIISFGITTAISLPGSVETDNEPWYSLHGVRLPAKPTQPGVYVHGRRKVVIK